MRYRAKNGKPMIPSIGPRAREIASTVGWSMTMTGTDLAFKAPTSRVGSEVCATGPNRLNAGWGVSLDNRPVAVAVLLLIRLTGAPVSKMTRYGPLPLIFTDTTMCLVMSKSNGTVTGLD